MAKKMTYVETISEIEEIIDEIENQDIDVDTLSKKVKRVSLLLDQCKQKLYKTELEVEKILDDIKPE